MQDPKGFVEPAPFVLQTMISALDFKCPTCRQSIKLHQLPHHQEQGCTPVTTAPPMPTCRVTLHEHEPNIAAAAAAAPHPATAVPADVPQPAPVPGYRAEQVQMEVVGPPPAADPIQTPGPAFGQLSLQQLLQSSQGEFSSLKEEVGLFIIWQFLAKSQGARVCTWQK